MGRDSKKEQLLKKIERIRDTSQTQQKRSEPTWQREDQGRILSSVVEQTADSVVITDPEGRIEYVNPAFEKQTGFSKEEAIEKTPRLVKSGKQNAALQAALGYDSCGAGISRSTD